ncbi:hypothetical protein [Endozoicomonas sp. 8E]|uniref:hypothetical protein n=1 Tax=Endozoicomonas sp. 8E TaxID=3035692 RepID=UPI0029393B80|nr:hypothetical protein [Endozoicomonas sp. 8E]WOG29135.1 hypothetical protein P6910_05575 [Endozoicomonas sp. 8E]
MGTSCWSFATPSERGNELLEFCDSLEGGNPHRLTTRTILPGAPLALSSPRRQRFTVGAGFPPSRE